MRKITLLLLCLMLSTITKAQDIAIHNNLVYDAMKNLSLGAEVALKPRTTVEVYGVVRPWKASGDKVNKYWEVESQYRFWTCQKYNGFFYGPYVLGGEYNIGNSTPFFGLPKCTKDNRYEGWFVGGGIGCGYEYALSKHWNIGAEIGVGYTYIKYKQYDCGHCGNIYRDSHENYWGVSKLGVNVIYLF